MDIDIKVAEHIKAQLDQLGNAIDAKIANAVKAAKDSGNAESVKLTADLKGELAGEIAKYNDLNKKFTDRLDLIETKAGRLDQVMARKTLADCFMQKFTDAGVKPKFRGQIEFTPKDFEGIRKSDDMTAANTYTNNVPGYDHLPEIHFAPDRTARIRDLILQGVTSQTAIEYIRETGFTDATDVVAEGYEIPQSDFDLTAYTANVRKIGTYVMLSEEMLDDVAGMTSYILARIPSKINKDEDTQILAGSGSGQNLSGLITNATAYVDALADSLVSRIDVIADAVRQAVDDEYMPSFVILHPADVFKMAMVKSSTGVYVLPWLITMQNLQLAGVPIVMSTAQTEGTFLVGSRDAAQVFFRKELVLEFSNQNEDNFIKGMVTVRAQKRLALAIYRPTALITGTFTVALAQGTA